MAIHFNSINRDVFNSGSAEFLGVEKERAQIITCGRLLMMEYAGKAQNAMHVLEKKAEEYTSLLPDAAGAKSYAETNRNLQHKMMLYAAKRACSLSGETAPADYNAFLSQQRKFMSDSTFLKVLAGIIRDVVTPIMPYTMSNALDWIAQTVTVPLGKTYELDVMSNDIFVFEDDSWGASRSKPSNYMYSYPITLNPTLKTAKATIKWYQMVGNDVDMGRFFNSFAAGLYSKIMAMAMGAFAAAGANEFFSPASLQFTNTSANWVTAASRVALANGTNYRNVVAVGHPSALTKALPSGVVNASTVNLDAALSTMLGIDWARYGFLGEYMGVRLMPIADAVVPGTQNTTIESIVPADKIWLFAMNGYRPIYVGMEEGTPIQIELDPTTTGDNSIDIIVSASIDAKPVFASKVAVINA